MTSQEPEKPSASQVQRERVQQVQDEGLWEAGIEAAARRMAEWETHDNGAWAKCNENGREAYRIEARTVIEAYLAAAPVAS